MVDNMEYLVMCRKDDQAYPLIRVTEETDDLWQLEFNGTIPRNPVMADFLSGPCDFVRKRIVTVMQAMNPEGVCFIPTELTLPKGDVIDDYICINVDDNTYVAMDKEKSEYTVDDDWDDEDDFDYEIEKVVLDRVALSKIPMNKRLIFRLREKPGYTLYHKSVVDAVLALEPTGVYFKNIEGMNF